MTINIPFDTFGDAGDVIHFAHANGFPPQTYNRFLTALGQNHQVTAMHARALWDDSDPWSIDNVWKPSAADLIRFLDAHNMRNIIGIGHSLGAVSTFYAAIERPDLFKQVVLIEPIFLPQHVLDRIYQNRDADVRQAPMVQTALSRRERWGSKEEAWERFRPKKVFQNFSDDVLWNYVNAGLKKDGAEFVLAYPREWEARFYAAPPLDCWELLPQLQHPTVALRGGTSTTLAEPAWAQWQHDQPAATFIEVPQTGHLLLLEQPEQLAQIILDNLLV